MKPATLVWVVALAATAAAAGGAAPAGKYTDKYDGVDVDEILRNRRLLGPYVQCILGRGKCAPEGKELRAHIVDALETECSKCTEVQKAQTRKIIQHLINHENAYWVQLTNKYDPTKKYVNKYEQELKEIND